METGSKNKMQAGAASKGAPEPREQEFFFSGGTEYEPQTVKAKTPEEAHEIWEKTRKKVEPSQTTNP